MEKEQKDRRLEKIMNLEDSDMESDSSDQESSSEGSRLSGSSDSESAS